MNFIVMFSAFDLVHKLFHIYYWMRNIVLELFLIENELYLHLDEGIFCRVMRFAWCNDPENYAGGSVATGRATLAGQVKGEHPDK